MHYKRQQYSKKLALALKTDDGAIHMPLTLNNGQAAHQSRQRSAFLGMTTPPPSPISHVPTPSPLPLVHKETGT